MFQIIGKCKAVSRKNPISYLCCPELCDDDVHDPDEEERVQSEHE